MEGNTTTFGGLLAGQAIGSITFVTGFFLGGPTGPVTIAGGAIIALCIAGLAFVALTEGEPT
ncbi:trimethylamine methyltransferase family protein [Halosolutus gelatinilyticus]|uniref:trimethylamine methyltransferase family protein n=1 Tax=Halosolutus gelatinilyticus TaxID=2931975 RepID=UPI001FF617F7|nr:trimethylamine methyltransferase family protein [Halosolutus gelatinilyticus]